MKHCWKIKALNEIRLNCSGALSNIAVTPYSPVDRCLWSGKWEKYGFGSMITALL